MLAADNVLILMGRAAEFDEFPDHLLVTGSTDLHRQTALANEYKQNPKPLQTRSIWGFKGYFNTLSPLNLYGPVA